MKSHSAGDAPSADTLIARAVRLSRYVRRLLDAEPALKLDAGLERPFSAGEMRSMLANSSSAADADLARELRRLRKRVMLRMIARDLGGVAELPEVLATTTALAEVAISHAVGQLDQRLAAQYGVPHGAASGRVQQLHVLGMGKLGGGELNASSDIDLIFAYPEEGETRGPRSKIGR